MKSTNNKCGLIWYHALCMDMLLDTNYTIVTYEDCDKFYLSSILTVDKSAYPEAHSRFFVNLCLWNFRHGFDKIAQALKDELLALHLSSSINDTFTGLRVMEALTLQLARAIESYDLNLMMKLDDALQRVIKSMASSLKTTKFNTERFKLHRLHFQLVENFDESRFSQLEKLKVKALKNRNFYAVDLITHTLNFWQNKLSENIKNFWLHHSTTDNPLKLSQISTVNQIFPFSLSIPGCL